MKKQLKIITNNVSSKKQKFLDNEKIQRAKVKKIKDEIRVQKELLKIQKEKCKQIQAIA